MRSFRIKAWFMAILMVLSVAAQPALAAETAAAPDVADTATDTQASPSPAASESPYSGITVGEATPETTPEPEKLFADGEGFVCDRLTDPNCESIFMISLDSETVVYALNPDERRPMAWFPVWPHPR